MRWREVAALALSAGLCAAQTPTLPSERLLAPYGLQHFSPAYRQAVDTFFTVRLAYQHADYAAAASVLELFWKAYPPGSPVWGRLLNEAQRAERSTGAVFGTPPGYYGLRMLSECVAWRMKTPTPPAGVPVRLSVILIGHSAGQPAGVAGAHRACGTEPADPLLAADGNAALHQALDLFLEYVRAITGGRLRVDLQVLYYRDLDVPMQVIENPHADPKLSAELAPGALPMVWAAVDGEVRAKTDWWFVVYPSHRPEENPANLGFAGTSLRR